jgi:mannose-6-phosphate isomerase-like protein (cupin superfamily)
VVLLLVFTGMAWAVEKSMTAAISRGGNTKGNESKEHSRKAKDKTEGTQMGKKGFVQDIDRLTIKNDNFRRVLYTAEHCQLVLMTLKPKEEIGEEAHKPDQFFRVEAGSGEVILNGVRTAIRAGFAVIVPSGARHNIINTGEVPLRLYTIYSPPNHRDGVVHSTRKEAEADNEHFDGKTTE